jgi:hypothetical protein
MNLTFGDYALLTALSGICYYIFTWMTGRIFNSEVIDLLKKILEQLEKNKEVKP